MQGSKPILIYQNEIERLPSVPNVKAEAPPSKPEYLSQKSPSFIVLFLNPDKLPLKGALRRMLISRVLEYSLPLRRSPVLTRSIERLAYIGLSIYSSVKIPTPLLHWNNEQIELGGRWVFSLLLSSRFSLLKTTSWVSMLMARRPRTDYFN